MFVSIETQMEKIGEESPAKFEVDGERRVAHGQNPKSPDSDQKKIFFCVSVIFLLIVYCFLYK